ncbi:MAG: ribosome small subunit-dependent GTPase A [Woeseia sp.]
MTESREGVVAATYGTRLQLRFADGNAVTARIKGRKLRPVCGDRVHAEPLANESDWVITAILKRRNELTRPNMRGKIEVLAANIDFLAVVCAATPRPDWFIIDRYLCAAELMKIDAAVVYNKADDGTVDDRASAELATFRDMGYATPVCSAKEQHNLDALTALLADHTAIIVGQSGVGKSSLINVLTSSEQRTATISEGSGEGRHTTVNSVMLALPAGGYVVDSPGVRDYAPSIAEPADVEFGFREIHRTGMDCRFSNCRHRHEPHCAVKDGVTAGTVSERRYESYRRMLLLTEQQDKARY